MALAYDARRATRDIGAVVRPHGVVFDEARVVADELGLPPWWINEQASAYVAPGGAARRVFDHPGLRVGRGIPGTSPGHEGARRQTSGFRRHPVPDRAPRTEYHRAVLNLCAEIFPEEEVPGPTRLVLEDVFNGD